MLQSACGGVSNTDMAFVVSEWVSLEMLKSRGVRVWSMKGGCRLECLGCFGPSGCVAGVCMLMCVT